MKNLKIICHECHCANTINMGKREDVVPCVQCKADLDDPFPAEVTDESAAIFIEQHDTAILIDFYSTTCGPCMAMYEDYEDAALGFSFKVKFLKINADKHTNIAKKYGVSGLPTIIAFNKGEEIHRISNQLSLTQLTVWAESLIS